MGPSMLSSTPSPNLRWACSSEHLLNADSVPFCQHHIGLALIRWSRRELSWSDAVQRRNPYVSSNPCQHCMRPKSTLPQRGGVLCALGWYASTADRTPSRPPSSCSGPAPIARCSMTFAPVQMPCPSKGLYQPPGARPMLMMKVWGTEVE